MSGVPGQEDLQRVTKLAMTRHFLLSDATCYDCGRACGVCDDGAYDVYACPNSFLHQQNRLLAKSCPHRRQFHPI